MAAVQKVGKYLLLQEESKNIVRTSYRAGEIEGGKLINHYRLELFNPKLAENTQFVEKLASQSAVASKVQHPNIAQKITLIHEDGQLAALFEYVEGTTLQQVMDRSRAEGFPFSIDHALLVASKLVTGLAAAKSKGVQHGLINPSFVFITNEGEVKISGFSVSSPLRAALGAHPDVAEAFKDYLPEGRLAGDGSPDRFDIFASGVILFEMLTGESFYAKGRDVAVRQRIDDAVAAADMEKIPASIAKILESAIDPESDGAYHDIGQMVTEMDNLIFSGEYSPTTFNLAFFMHSAFRQEIESVNEAIKEEREKTFETTSTGAPTPEAAPVQKAEAAPVVSEVAAPQAPKKSALPWILAAVAVVAIVATILVVVFLPKTQESAEDKFQKQQEELMRERDAEAQRLAQERQEMLRAEIDALKDQIENRNKEEAERLQEEIQDMDEKIKLVQEKKQREQELLEMRLRLEQLEKEREAERRMKEEQERLAQQQEQERLRKQREQAAAAAKETEATQEEAESEEPTAVAETRTTPDETEPPPETAQTQVAEAQTTKPAETTAETAAGTTQETLPAVPAPISKVPITPPEEGELVEMDETVTPPALDETLRFLEVPPKAVKMGVVNSGEIKTFLVKALVNEKGRVEDAKIVRNPLTGIADDFGMEARALKTARKLKFQPGEKMGVKVKVWTTVGIHFKAF